MSDSFLLVYGCAVTFIAFAGAYVALRERYLDVVRARWARRGQSSPPASELRPAPLEAGGRRAPPAH